MLHICFSACIGQTCEPQLRIGRLAGRLIGLNRTIINLFPGPSILLAMMQGRDPSGGMMVHFESGADFESGEAENFQRLVWASCSWTSNGNAIFFFLPGGPRPPLDPLSVRIWDPGGRRPRGPGPGPGARQPLRRRPRRSTCAAAGAAPPTPAPSHGDRPGGGRLAARRLLLFLF